MLQPCHECLRAKFRLSFLISRHQQADAALCQFFTPLLRRRNKTSDTSFHIHRPTPVQHAVFNHAVKRRMPPRRQVTRRHNITMTRKGKMTITQCLTRRITRKKIRDGRRPFAKRHNLALKAQWQQKRFNHRNARAIIRCDGGDAD